MAGIYIHIPFCRKYCYYCDFHRSVDLKIKNEFIQSLLAEIDFKRNYLEGENIETIYFGGGTPSVLSTKEINLIIYTIKKNHKLLTNSEITFEANPEDLTSEYLKKLKNETLINRLSIGIQSFKDNDLLRMNRRHNAKTAIESIENALISGFENLSVDLIYGLPFMSVDDWRQNLIKVFSYQIKHLSAYHLTYEPGTDFYKQLKIGILSKTDEETSIKQFELLSEIAETYGFVQYEISNLAIDGFYSKHNSNYWMQKKYLGIGPSAHSYNLVSRHWNVSDNYKYIQNIKDNQPFFETEFLDNKTKFNEYLMTRLRTIWGVNLSSVKNEFGNYYADYLEKSITKFLESDVLFKDQEIITITKKGKFISDFILAELIME